MLILFEIKINNTGSSDLSGRALYLGGGGMMFVFVCCQVVVSALSRSLVQRPPTESGM